MTADTPPAALPAVWWSPSRQAAGGVAPVMLWAHRSDLGYVEPSALPDDAVRLIPAEELETDLLDANDRLGRALVEIGMALGLPRPTARHRWGAPEILARIAATDTPAQQAITAEQDTVRDLEAELVACRARLDAVWRYCDDVDDHPGLGEITTDDVRALLTTPANQADYATGDPT